MQTIGERLEEARKRKGVSIREASEATKVRGEYLHKFESNQFDLRLPEIYVRGFLKTYALFLKLPADRIVSDYKGLGLNEPKSRNLQRESLGRMDLSVATAKPAARDEGSTGAAAGDPAAPADAGGPENNPATFRPRAGAAPQIDRALVIKAVLALILLAGVVILLIFGISFLASDTPPRNPATASAPPSIVTEPVAGEPTVTLFASAPVAVTVTQVADAQATDGQVLLRVRLAAGEQRIIPHRGQLRIEANPPEAVQLEIAKRRHPMPPGKDGLPVRSAVIKGP
jgi:transcriptional regulator with XRE-family HTH domain